MCVDRRGFMQVAAVAAGASLLVSRGASSEETPLPKSLESLSSMVTDIEPITDDERKGRIAHAQRLMKENGLGAIYLESGSTLFYYTGVRWGQSERMFAMVMPAQGEPAYVCPAFEEERARERIRFGNDIRTWEEHESPYKLVAQIFADRGVRTGKVGIEERTRFFFVEGIQKECPGIELVSADPVTVGCRIRKSETELALMQTANDITLKAYKTTVEALEEGMTHFEASKIIAAAHDAMGVRGGAGVQFGEYTAFPHGSSKPQVLKAGDVVMMDGGCNVDGYRSDITRTVIFGKPSDRQRELWDLERKAQDAARKVITDAGYGPEYKYFTHRVGHGIGLDGHEWTYLVRGNDMPLAPGMCFSNEPGIYVYGEFGVRLEDCFYVTEEGGHLFTEQSPSIDQPFV